MLFQRTITNYRKNIIIFRCIHNYFKKHSKIVLFSIVALEACRLREKITSNEGRDLAPLIEEKKRRCREPKKCCGFSPAVEEIVFDAKEAGHNVLEN